MSFLHAAALLLAGPAHAACQHGGIGIDGDGDGWCLNDVPADCDDGVGGASINPGLPEDGTDNVDEDCDGSASVRREFVTAFDSPLIVAQDMILTNASVPGGYVRLAPTSTTAASVRLGKDLVVGTGELTVVVDVQALAGATCGVKAVWSTGFSYSGLSTTGVHAVVMPVPPGETVTWLGIECQPASGVTADFDWMTVQNGGYEWAPMVNTSLSFSGMGVPTGGRESVLRLSEGYSAAEGGLIFTGSDVGGLAWAEAHDPELDPTVWTTANGGWHEWNDASEWAVMEVFSEWRGEEGGDPNYRDPGEFDVYVLTGEDEWGHGGLWYTADIENPWWAPQSWTEIDETMVAFKHRDDCPYDGKELSSGRLLIDYPGDPGWLVIGSGGPTTSGTRGIHLWDKSGGAGLPAEYWPGLPDSTTGGYSALPSALAGGEANDRRFVLVGYRVRAAGAADASALYLCPADFDPASATPLDPSSVPECVVVASGGLSPLDVRDIEPDPNDSGRFFIADGGRAWGGSACSTGEPTVYVLEVGSPSPGVWSFALWDSDTTASAPSWLVDGAGAAAAPYYSSSDDACFRSGASSGDLVPPDPSGTAEAHDISSITVDPASGWIFAFYPQMNNSRRWGCANVFRAEIPGSLPSGTPLAWEPFQHYVWGEMYWEPTSAGAAADDNAEQRRAHVYAQDSFIDDEPLKEMWAGSFVHDAVFVPGASGASLLTGGAFHWWVLPDGHAWDTEGVGWDSIANVTTDLDEAAWILAWAGDVYDSVFQDLVATTAAVCPGCLPWYIDTGNEPELVVYDALLGGGSMDYKYATLYGENVGPQLPADRPCEFHLLNSSPVDMETWVDLDGTAWPQAWMIVHGQDPVSAGSTVVDDGLTRGIFFSEQTSTRLLGDEWCWDGVGLTQNGTLSAGFTVPNYLRSSLGWNLVCQDSNLVSTHGFPACDTSSDPFAMEGEGVGLPRALEVLGPDTAVIAAVAARRDQTSSGEDAATAGVWVVQRDPNGLIYTEVPFDSSGMGGCSKAEFFEYDWDTTAGALVNRRLAMDVHPDSGWDTGDPVRLFLSSRHPHCGVAEVEFTRGSEASADWTLLDLDYDGADPDSAPDCALCTVSDCPGAPLGGAGQYNVNGVHASRDGRWLFVYGGETIASSTRDAVCAIDLDTGGGGAYTSFAPVVRGAQLQMEIRTLISQPHVEDVWYFGGAGSSACDTCTPPGIFALQRRRALGPLGNWTWRWGFYRLSEDDLAVRAVVDLDWGPAGDRYDPAHVLYASTAGGSWWDGVVSW